MSRKALRIRDFLAHILQAIERDRKIYRDIDLDAFRSNEMAQDAVVRALSSAGRRR